MVEIRAERITDVAAIQTLIRAAFPTDAEARLVERLRGADRLTVSLVAETEGFVVGHVAFSPVTVAQPVVAPGIGLAPLAVLAEYRCRGIGSALVRAGIDACRAANFGWCVVLGEPEFYGRFGFRSAAASGLTDEYGGGAAFQVLELRQGALPHGAGLVRYAEEFAIFG